MSRNDIFVYGRLSENLLPHGYGRKTRRACQCDLPVDGTWGNALLLNWPGWSRPFRVTGRRISDTTLRRAVGADNYRDYVGFMQRIQASPIPVADKGAIAHEVQIDSKRLICIHESFDLG